MSIIGPASWGAKFLARALSSEGMLGVAGCSMAVASGGFALYTTMHGPLGAAEPNSHYFTVFAQLSRRTHAERLAHVDPAAPVVVAPVVVATEEIDPVVTGSIPERADKANAVGPQQRVSAADRPILSNVLLRQIDGDSALVEVNDNLVVFKIGDMIPGAGRLMAMTRQGGRPALQTSRGLIVETR